MGDVNHDTDAVHAGDDPFAKGADAAVFGVAFVPVTRCRRVADVVVAAVGERDVASPELVIIVHETQIAPDDEAVLDADDGDALAGGVDAHDVVDAVGQLDPVRVQFLGSPVDGLEFDHGRRLRRGEGRIVTRLRLAHVDDEEGAVETTLAHLRQVDFVGASDSRIDGFAGELGGDVDVGVEGEDAVVDPPGPVLQAVISAVLQIVAGYPLRSQRHRQRQRPPGFYYWHAPSSFRCHGEG